MSNFTKTFNFTTQFEDDTVTVVMERLKRADTMKLLPFFGEPDSEGKQKISFKNRTELMDAMSDILPKTVKSVTGLHDENGEAISFEDVMNETYFAILINEIVDKLFENSFVSGEEIKKSNAQPIKDLSIPKELPDSVSEG